MSLDDGCQLSKLISSVEKSKSYLEKQVDLEAEYGDLIDNLNTTIDRLKNNRPTIAIISPAVNLALEFKEKNEADNYLRSHYNFEVINLPKNAMDVVNNSGLIFLIYYAKQRITASHQKIINLAQKQEIPVTILVKQKQKKYTNLSYWLKSQNRDLLEKTVILLDEFIDLGDREHLKIVRKFLIQQLTKVKILDLEQQSTHFIAGIQGFFQEQTNKNWQQIKHLKNSHLQGKKVHQSQQNIKQQLNDIERQLRQSMVPIRKSINNSRSDYLSFFMPDGWMFELEQIIQSSQVKIVSESGITYLYLTINKNNQIEYLHSYILGLYQQKTTEALKQQWLKINHEYGDGGLIASIELINSKFKQIELVSSLLIEESKIEFNSLVPPKLELTEIIDFNCLKINSRIVFDYKYTQSSWFKLLILSLTGAIIYLVTKLYFDRGIYIGFIILVFQLVNIFTGQNIRTVKLKQYRKELQRHVNSKYQILIRLVVDKLIQTSIASLDREEKQYQQQIKEIALTLEQKLDNINWEIERLKSHSDRLNKDQDKILSWFNNSISQQQSAFSRKNRVDNQK